MKIKFEEKGDMTYIYNYIVKFAWFRWKKEKLSIFTDFVNFEKKRKDLFSGTYTFRLKLTQKMWNEKFSLIFDANERNDRFFQILIILLEFEIKI